MIIIYAFRSWDWEVALDLMKERNRTCIVDMHFDEESGYRNSKLSWKHQEEVNDFWHYNHNPLGGESTLYIFDKNLAMQYKLLHDSNSFGSRLWYTTCEILKLEIAIDEAGCVVSTNIL
jgi:hypothetical protein